MNRRNIIAAWVVLIIGVIIGVVTIAVSPVWLTVLLIRPQLIRPVSDFVMHNMTKQMMRIMMSRVHTPTMPMNEMKLCGVLSTGLST